MYLIHGDEARTGRRLNRALGCRALSCLLVLLSVAHGATSWVGAEEEATGGPVAARGHELITAPPKAFARLAQARYPDPWLVAQWLRSEGHALLALRYAKAADESRPEVDESLTGLPKYLEGAPDPKTEDELHRAIVAAREALGGDRLESAGKALASYPEPSAPSILSVERAFLRWRLQLRAEDLKEPAGAVPRGASGPAPSDAFYAEAIRAADTLGWLAMVCRIHVAVGRARWHRGQYERAHAAFEALLAAEQKIGSPMGEGRAHYALHLTSRLLGLEGDATDHLLAAGKLAHRAHDAEYIAKALRSASDVQDGRGEVRFKSYCDAARALVELQELARKGPLSLPERFQPDEGRLLTERVKVLLNCSAAARGLPDNNDEARRRAQEALVVARESGVGRLIQIAEAGVLEFEAAELEGEGELEKALAPWEKARDRYRSANTPRELGRTLRHIASVELRLGRLTPADRNIAEALEVLSVARGGSEYCVALILAAKIAVSAGRTDGVLSMLQEAACRETVQGDCELEVEVLLVEAEYFKRLGNYSQAMARLTQAENQCADSGLDLAQGYVQYLLGALHFEMGQFDDALGALDRGQEKLDGSVHRRTLRQVRRLRARVLAKLEDYQEAQRLLDELLHEELESGDQLGQAATYSAVADLKYLQAESLRAREQKLLHEALTARTHALNGYDKADARRQATVVRAQLGRELAKVGDYKQARIHLEHARADSLEDQDISSLANCEEVLAEVYLAQGELDLAMDSAWKSITLINEFGLDLAEGEGEVARAQVQVWRHVLGARAAHRKGDAAALYRFLESGRSAALLAAIGGRETLRNTKVDKDILKREDEARQRLAKALEKMSRYRSGPKYVAARKNLRSARQSLEDVIQEGRRDVRMEANLAYPEVPALEEVQKLLVEGDRLILYGQAFTRLVAVLVTKDRIEMQDLAEMATIRARIRRLLEDPGRERALVVEEVPALRALILDPLKLGPGTRRLLISPYDKLSVVPFSVLVPDHDVVFIPSATVFAALRKGATSGGEHVLAIGNPSYKDRGLGQLEATLKEIEEITKGRGEDVTLLGEEATAQGFLARLTDYKRWLAIHFACHGIADPNDPRASYLALTASGDAGELRASEVFGLRLSTDMVVLSGCQTGKGEILAGEGLEGLTRAFLFAGAPRVIASLWNVDDAATGALMTEFYRRWRGAEGLAPRAPATALREAQAHIRTQNPKWADPAFWGAWVLWGLPD